MTCVRDVVLIFFLFRELIKVGQRNFRKYMSMREWGWFIIIQKTRPLIGRPDPIEELRLLEEKAAATYGVYKEKCDTKVGLFSCLDAFVLFYGSFGMRSS